METKCRPSDSGSGGTDTTAFIQCINGRDTQIKELWCLDLDRISCEVHPTARLDIVSVTVWEFFNNYLSKMDAESRLLDKFKSTTESKFWYCMTNPEEVDFHTSPISWLKLRMQGGAVPIIPIITG